MKLIIQNTRIVGTATDDYNGPDEFLDAPEGFTIDDAGKYTVVDGALVLAVPTSITRAQAKSALLEAGLLDLVQPAINSIADPKARAQAQIDWDDRLTFERSNGALVGMATMLGMTEAQIDDLFRLGATL